LKEEVRGLETILRGGSSPFQKGKPAPGPDDADRAAQRAKANAQILSEMIQVVTLKGPENRAEFGSMVDTLNQGASYEGVYNGLVHSSTYRRLEQARSEIHAETLHVFSEELARLELELKEPTEFTAASAGPLAPPMNPADFAADGGRADGGNTLEFGKAVSPSPKAAASPAARQSRQALVERFMALFANSSVFTMKRILGDEAMRVIAEKQSASPQVLADWYGTWVARLASSYTVNFGLPLRNNADEVFHRDWALHVQSDQLIWEVLNRVHRLINMAQFPPPRASAATAPGAAPAVKATTSGGSAQ
jgi:hypothetical protein